MKTKKDESTTELPISGGHVRTPCDDCVMHSTVRPTPGGGKHGGIMIIGDSPSYLESDEGEYYVDTTGRYLGRELYKVGIDISTCYTTKAVKCYHGEKKPTKATIKACRERLFAEIDYVKPKHILVLGSTALETLSGKGNVGTHRGTLMHFKGIPVISTYSPAAIIRSPRLASEFISDLNYFSRLISGWKAPDDFKWRVVKDERDLKDFSDDFLFGDAIAYDIETTALHDTGDEKLVMLGIATRKEVYVFPIETPHKSEYLRTSRYKDILDAVLDDSGKKTRERVAHNAKFDNRWLRSRGLHPDVTYDTFLASYVLNVTTPHGLKYLAKTHLGAIDYDEGIEFKKDLTAYEFSEMAKYCALDCYYTLKLYDYTKEELSRDKGLENVFKRIVMPGERVLQKIEDKGVYVNKEKLLETKSDYEMERDRVDEEIEELLPVKWKGKLNMNSPKQLAELLYKDLKLPVIALTDKGEPSTGKSALLRLVEYHDLPKLILERRKYDKALVGFLVPWIDYLKKDGRLHTTYKIAHTATGRLSAEDPNLQQVPRDKNVRNLIAAPKGKVFIEADYSQIELRIAAFIAGEESMKDAYRRGEDVHAKTAASVSRVSLEDVTKEMRSRAKAVNFGFLYGMWWKSFKSYAFDSYGVVVTDTEAEHARKAFFETYPEFLPWHDRQRREVAANGFIRTKTGRIRHLPDIYSPDKDLRGSAERQAINTPVQSFASDITLLAMILIDKNIERLYKGRADLVGQVHDAIMVEADEEIGRDVALMVKKCMESVPILLSKYFGIDLDLPIVAEVEMGEAWGIGEIIEPEVA